MFPEIDFKASIIVREKVSKTSFLVVYSMKVERSDVIKRVKEGQGAWGRESATEVTVP